MAHSAWGRGAYNPRMGARTAAVLLTLLALPSAAGDLGESVPPGMPDARNLGWEQITGDVATAVDGARYEFFVNPSRQAIYEVVRYRFSRHGQAETVKFLWNRYPTFGEGPACYSQEKDGSWRRLSSSSLEYRDEMMTAMRVYSMHRQAVQASFR